MDQLKTFINTWWGIFLWAHICMWERVTGQEVSCPACWKCTMMRWLLLMAYPTMLAILVYKLIL